MSVLLPNEDLNELLSCSLCGGYLIDATTISDCMHSFCRSCILLHFQQHHELQFYSHRRPSHASTDVSSCSKPSASTYQSVVESLQTSTTFWCPVCHTPLHTARPELLLRPDHGLQSLIYKLVPGLYEAEMDRRREFYTTHPPSDSELRTLTTEQRGLVFSMRPVQHDLTSPVQSGLPRSSADEPEDAPSISLCLEYFTGASTIVTADGDKSRMQLHFLVPQSTPLHSLQYLLQHKFDLFHTDHVPVFFLPQANYIFTPETPVREVIRVSEYKFHGPLHLYFSIVREGTLTDMAANERKGLSSTEETTNQRHHKGIPISLQSSSSSSWPRQHHNLMTVSSK